jgi:MtrB/PioB family decaheme-associated outer membrane protein
MEGLRVTGSYDRESRQNKTPVRSFPTVATDMFVGSTMQSNTPFSFTLDRFKLIGDYGGGLPNNTHLTGGAEYDMRERTYQEVVTTREMTLWGKFTAQPTEKLSGWLKYAYSWRDNSVYGTSVWFGYPENPLLRKFYLADRQRNMIEGRFDYAINEKYTLGISADFADDDYTNSSVGLTSARSANFAVELATLFSEQTQGRAYLQTQSVRSQQSGSEAFAAPDWTGRQKDTFDVLGIGVKHIAIPNKLDFGADLTVSRSRSDIAVDNILAAAPFPTARTKLETFKLYGTYNLKDNLSITGSYQYEHYDTTDWRLDGIAPGTVPNLLSLGAQSPNYSVNVFRVAMRYRF